MKDTVRLLEDRVARAVRQLKELADERDRLKSEVGKLQLRLEQMEARTLDAAREVAEASDAPPAWVEHRAEILSALKETVAELRGE
jgi:chromosome segregation ATPase